MTTETLTQATPTPTTDPAAGYERERHYNSHRHTFYSSDDKLAAVELLREAGYWFRWSYTNSCGQDIGFWTDGNTYPTSHEYYDHAMSTIALYTSITPEQIKNRAAQNRRAEMQRLYGNRK